MRSCAVCGKEITEKGRKKYCSKACMLKANATNKRLAQQDYNDRQKQAQRRAKMRISTLSEKAAKAREVGLSYGYYEGFRYMKALRAEKKERGA